MIELPEGTTAVVDRDHEVWSTEPGLGYWETVQDRESSPRLTLAELAKAYGPLRPVGPPLSAPEPPMAEPTKLGTHVQCDDGEWVAARPEGTRGRWLSLGVANHFHDWPELRNPRSVDSSPLTLDAVLAELQAQRDDCFDSADTEGGCAVALCMLALRAKFGGTR